MLFLFVIFLVHHITFFCTSLQATDQSGISKNKRFQINLIIDNMPEEMEDSGGVIRINADFDEENKNAKGDPLADYQADEKEGHRIVPDDPGLKDGLLILQGKSDGGRWRLTFPENIKIWKRLDNGKYVELISSLLSDEVEVPHFCELKIEGIKGSQITNDVKVLTEFIPNGSKKVYKDSVLLTVLETKFALSFDDGPIPEKTEKIVAALKNFYYNGEPIKAAFFEIGHKVHEHADLTRFVDQNGHLVYNHTYYHIHYGQIQFQANQSRNDIFLCEAEIRQALGKEPERIIRNRSLAKDSIFETEASKLGYKICHGEVLQDWGDSCTVKEIKQRAEQILENWNTKENPNLHPYPAILIFHEFPDAVSDYIGEIISYLQDQGFVLVNFDPRLIY